MREIGTPKRVICYLRRSRQDLERERRTGEDTLATQKRIMLEVLGRLGAPFDVVEEIGSGERIETRPVFRQVLEALARGHYDAVAVKEIPRLGRGTYRDMGQIYDLLVERRLPIITPYKIFDPANPADARQIRFELFLAREEFELIKERLVGAKYNLAAEGRWMAGAAPYGYRLDPQSGRLVPQPEEAEVVRLIFDLFVRGSVDGGRQTSFRAVADHLGHLGIPGPRSAGWHPLAVRRILANPVYLGTVRYRTRRRLGSRYSVRPEPEWIVVENAHEAIVDRETWQQAQLRLRRPLPRVPADAVPGELAGLVICGRCGRRMVRQYTVREYRRKDGGISRYPKEFLRCPTTACTCVKYREVEAGVLEYLKRLGKIDRRPELAATARTRPRDSQAALLAKKAAEIRRRLAFVYEKYEAGVYDDASFLERRDALNRQLAALEAAAGAIPDGGEPPDQDGPPATFLAVYLATVDRALKNRLLRALLERVVVTKTGRGRFDLAVYPRFPWGPLV